MKRIYFVRLVLTLACIIIFIISGQSKEKEYKNSALFDTKPVIEMVKVGDNESLSQGFKLSKDTRLKILAIGEFPNEEMVDYGWIVDADSRKTVWEMEYKKTERAGGADKNRLVDEEITLKKGNYVVYYSTDDSHSYAEWNDDPPSEQDKYGITIWTVNESDRANVSLFNEKDYKNENVISEIVRVKNNDFESKEFALDKETKIRVYAIGEGVHGSMADYGWIEEDTSGKTVWEMNYRKTDHAGGAAKNRMEDDIITLPKGKYRVYYETDNSHAYKTWNSDPPQDPENYGITLSYVKE